MSQNGELLAQRDQAPGLENLNLSPPPPAAFQCQREEPPESKFRIDSKGFSVA